MSMSSYYNKEGYPISLEEWTELFEDMEYRVVRKTECHNGTHISTVWLGLEHGMDGSGPLIFETMVTHPDSKEEEMYRYSTLDQAINHHEHLCGESTQEEATYLGKENPSRWDQIRWEIEDED